MDEEGAEERLKAFKKHVKTPIIPVSALTEQGIDEALYKCMDLLEKTPIFPLYAKESEQLDNKVYTLDDEPEFTIQRLDAHHFRILGDKIIKFYKMTNISTDEGMMVLMKKIRALRIDDELERKGAEDGDTVYLDDFAFEYYR